MRLLLNTAGDEVPASPCIGRNVKNAVPPSGQERRHSNTGGEVSPGFDVVQAVGARGCRCVGDAHGGGGWIFVPEAHGVAAIAK